MNFLNKEKDNSAQPICIVNIGGISNATIINDISNNIEKDLIAYDIGPGNCLIDEWIRSNSNFKFDENGKLATMVFYNNYSRTRFNIDSSLSIYKTQIRNRKQILSCS